MAVTVADVMRRCNNYFPREAVEGEFRVSGDGVLSPAVDAPYIAITGSLYHDGVYKAGEAIPAPEETFTGRVWALAPTRGFLALCEDIAEFETKHAAGAPSSEAFGGYSVTYRAGMETWQGAFAPMLAGYTRMFSEVVV